MTLQAWPSSQLNQCDSTIASIKFYEDGIPEFIESELESLYECHMTTIIRFRQYYPLDTAYVYTSYNRNQITTAIVYRKAKDKVIVYNEQMHIPAAELNRFVRAIYQRYPDVSQIHFYALDLAGQSVAFPKQKMACLEKICLALPKSTSIYLSMLSKNLSYNIRRAERRITKDIPNACFEFKAGQDVKREELDKIIELNRARMEAKHQTCYHTPETTSKLFQLVKRYGVVGIFSVAGSIQGGIVLLRIACTYLLQVNAHHPDYDKYNLGTICCINGISYAINNGGTTFNFGWGAFEYKYKLLGKKTDLYQLCIYKSYAYMLRDTTALCKRRLLNLQRYFRLSLARHHFTEGSFVGWLRRSGIRAYLSAKK